MVSKNKYPADHKLNNLFCRDCGSEFISFLEREYAPDDYTVYRYQVSSGYDHYKFYCHKCRSRSSHVLRRSLADIQAKPVPRKPTKNGFFDSSYRRRYNEWECACSSIEVDHCLDQIRSIVDYLKLRYPRNNNKLKEKCSYCGSTGENCECCGAPMHNVAY
jgi:hypothetical protein